MGFSSIIKFLFGFRLCTGKGERGKKEKNKVDKKTRKPEKTKHRNAKINGNETGI